MRQKLGSLSNGENEKREGTSSETFILLNLGRAKAEKGVIRAKADPFHSHALKRQNERYFARYSIKFQ
jgi:hypothetical protein